MKLAAHVPPPWRRACSTVTLISVRWLAKTRLSEMAWEACDIFKGTCIESSIPCVAGFQKGLTNLLWNGKWKVFLGTACFPRAIFMCAVF